MRDQQADLEKALRALVPNYDIVCSKSLYRFLEEYYQHLEYFYYIDNIVDNSDKIRVISATSLLKHDGNNSDKERLSESLGDKNRNFRKYLEYRDIFLQYLSNGIVNSFQRYFSLAINEAAKRRPEIISSSQTIRIDEILKFKSVREIIYYAIDRKVNDLSYGGLLEMEKYFESNLGISMFGGDQYRKNMMKLFIEIRNISVHNGGVVDKMFFTKIPNISEFDFKIGKKFVPTFDQIAVLSANALEVIKEIDVAVSKKFRLSRKKYRNWNP